MFDRTYIDQSVRGPSRIDVHEHRAPTDQSVKLLSEMERAAQERLVSAMLSGQDNALRVLWCDWHLRAGLESHVCALELLVNGQRHTIELEALDVERFKNAHDFEGLLKLMHRKLAERLASKLMPELLRTFTQKIK